MYFFKNYFTVLCTCSWGTVRSFTHGVGLVPLMSLYQKYIFILSDEFMTFAMYITKKSCKILCNLLDFFVINIANVHVLLYFSLTLLVVFVVFLLILKCTLQKLGLFLELLCYHSILDLKQIKLRCH